jgi:RNA polymerase sigma-70 factor (ECF subfamily)
VINPQTLANSTPTDPGTRVAFRPGRPDDDRPRSDRALLEQIAAGDQSAMRTLFTRHRDQAFRFIRRLTKDDDLAEDVLIETFFEVWRSAERFEGRSAFVTWLLAIARHKALSAMARSPSQSPSREPRDSREVEEQAAAEIPDLADDPERMLQAKDLSAALRGCLMRLSTKHTEVIDLVYYHDKSVTETAQILRLPEATVKTRMFYARRKLGKLVRARLGDATACPC